MYTTQKYSAQLSNYRGYSAMLPRIKHFPVFSTAGESLYLILGVDKEASPDEIKKAYRKVLYSSNFH